MYQITAYPSHSWAYLNIHLIASLLHNSANSLGVPVFWVMISPSGWWRIRYTASQEKKPAPPWTTVESRETSQIPIAETAMPSWSSEIGRKSSHEARRKNGRAEKSTSTANCRSSGPCQLWVSERCATTKDGVILLFMFCYTQQTADLHSSAFHFTSCPAQ